MGTGVNPIEIQFKTEKKFLGHKGFKEDRVGC